MKFEDLRLYFRKLSSVEKLNTEYKEDKNGKKTLVQTYLEGEIIERISKKKNSNTVNYTMWVENKPMNDSEQRYVDYGFNLISSFLMDMSLTDRPLFLLMEFNLETSEEYQITDEIKLSVNKNLETTRFSMDIPKFS